MRIPVIDSHTAGEPTRVVLEGNVLLQGQTMQERLEDFRSRYDNLRSGLVNEPRGSDVLVGALLTEPVTPGAVAGVIFFNNVGYLGMCGHGTIGVIETLRALGRIQPGSIALDTPVGRVSAVLDQDGQVTLTNVVSHLVAQDVTVEVEGLGTISGDIAYGGNWFYVVRTPHFEIDLSHAANLTRQAQLIKEAVHLAGHTRVDHVELEGVNGRNFVLCPGGAYDRSPCGTGTSAKMACLFARGELAEGELFEQFSISGSSFVGSVRAVEGGVEPTIRGRAYVVAESTLIFDESDPLRWGLV